MATTKRKSAARTAAASKNEPQVRQREDGFWEVSGVTGYFAKHDAIRVARQVAAAKDADEQYRERTPGAIFDDGMTASEAEAEEEEAPEEEASPPAQ